MKKAVFILSLCISFALSAEIRLPSIFSDGMVLQQKQELPVWGWAEKGTDVTVTFKGQIKTAKAGENGKWMVRLQPVEASAEGSEMIVKSGSESKKITDILVGEVWFCGGQSNMDFNLAALSQDTREKQYQPIADYIKKEIKTADDPLLRQIKVPRAVSPFEELSDFKGSWIKAVPGKVQKFTGTGYFFARELRKKLNVPVGLLNCNWGGTRVQPWIPLSKFQSNKKLKKYYENQLKGVRNWDKSKADRDYLEKLKKWKERLKKAKEDGTKPPQKPRKPEDPSRSNRLPATLYNAMTHTLVPYAIRGVIWYQGESNAHHYPDQYREHFTALIEGWREAWGQDKLYFYWCQLAQYKDPLNKPAANDKYEKGWVSVCNQQRLTLELPNTGMAVLNDIGEAKDIHPRNKIDAGKRLSLWAFKQIYGEDDLIYSGPLYKSSEIKGNKMIIKFDSAGSGLIIGHKNLLEPVKRVSEPLKGFQIKGRNGKWYWAEAAITGKDTVEVWHEKVEEPVEVRYAWAPNPEGANLYNSAGLPASLFKTE